jgi:hypothetical protein
MKRFKRILKWTAVILGALLAVLLIVNAVVTWKTDARLEQQLAAIRDAGDPISLADLARKPIPPDKNAATYISQAQSEMVAIQNEMAQWNDAEKVPDFWEYFGEKQPMPKKMHSAMKAIYAAHPALIRLLQKAVECPDYDIQCDYSVPPEELLSQMLPNITELRNVARVLAYRSRLLAIDGNCDEAARLCMAIFQLGRHADRNPLLVSYLVALTVRAIAAENANWALQAGPVSKEVRHALDAELAAQEGMAGYAFMIKSERAYGVDWFRRRVPLRNLWLYSRGHWNREESEYLDAMAGYFAMVPDRRPYRQSASTLDKIGSQIAPGTSASTRDLLSCIGAAHQFVARGRAKIRCLRVLNALQTHVSAAGDKVPKLTELGLPVETTTDPYTGEPLHAKKMPQGWVVYSVGCNYVDDGGKVEDPNEGDVGVGPPTAEKRDAK